MKQPVASNDPVSEVLSTISNFLRDFFCHVEKGKVVEQYYDEATLAIICGVVILVLISAFWAASIASARRHNALLSFCLGLLFPFVYPIVITFAMNLPDQWNLKKKKREEEKKAIQAVIDEAEAKEIPKDESGALEYSATPAYFEKIARKSDGQPAGPWNVVFAGNAIVVLKIIEVLPEALNVEFQGHKGETLKMRIPYGKIDSWEAVQE